MSCWHSDFNSIRLTVDNLLVRYMKYPIYFTHSSLICSDKTAFHIFFGSEKVHILLFAWSWTTSPMLCHCILPFMGDNANSTEQDALDLKPFWHQSSLMLQTSLLFWHSIKKKNPLPKFSTLLKFSKPTDQQKTIRTDQRNWPLSIRSLWFVLNKDPGKQKQKPNWKNHRLMVAWIVLSHCKNKTVFSHTTKIFSRSENQIL